MAKLMIALNRDEIQNQIPYSLICMTREGSVWNTMKRKRRWKFEFTEQERDKAISIFKLSHTWTLVKGVPDEVKMSLNTYDLWQKIGMFCGSL